MVRVAALVVGVGIWEIRKQIVVLVEDAARGILSWMRVETNQRTVTSCNTFAATPIAVSHLVIEADQKACGITKPMFIT